MGEADTRCCSQEAIDREIENKLATQRSATDARDSQAERLKDIVERTSMCVGSAALRADICIRNLIDVSLAAAASSQLADQDAEARKKKYPYVSVSLAYPNLTVQTSARPRSPRLAHSASPPPPL